eukprot:TRINITY_DN26722_c0_g1_i1.p1 TRINITY_DN26722_c0_g1~~TRINITY_DN26722_c0_g1_i1.p1  ORF type:complete len:452 (+),score=28.32 TRINITY_DN26722_c0_g1_i1:127-1482(+)
MLSDGKPLQGQDAPPGRRQQCAARNSDLSFQPHRDEPEDDLECDLHARSRDDDLIHPARGSHVFLDVTRTICVFIVVIDHGDREFGMVNTCFAQNWTVQCLFLVSGLCYCMSTRPLCGYLVKIMAYFCLGVTCNILAWQWLQRNWRADIFNAVFQFWFVVGLMAYSILVAPLEIYLRKAAAVTRLGLASEESGSPLHATEDLPTCLASALGRSQPAHASMHETKRQELKRDALLATIAIFALRLLIAMTKPRLEDRLIQVDLEENHSQGLVFWGISRDPNEASRVVDRVLGYVSESLGSFTICFLGPLLLPDARYLAWVLICYMYALRVLFFHGPEDRPFHHMNLFMLAVVCYHFGLKHRRRMSDFVLRYWFLVMGISAGLLWPPGLQRRMDEEPPNDLLMRFRYNGLELLAGLICVLQLTLCASRCLYSRPSLRLWLCVGVCDGLRVGCV